MATDASERHLEEGVLEINGVTVNENPEEIDEAIEKLREWVNKENFVAGETCTDSLTLLKILRFCDFDLEKSQKRFKVHYKSRLAIPDWFSARDPLNPTLHEIIKLGIFVPLKYDQLGRRIVLSRFGHFDPSVYNVRDVYKVLTMTNDVINLEEKLQINGFVNLIDFSEFGAAHAMANTPVIGKLVSLMQECFPVKVECIYCWKPPVVLNAVHFIASMFLSKKSKERIQFLGNNEETLHSVIPAELLPTEYGGTAGPIQSFIDSFEKEITSSRERLSFDDDYHLIKGKK